MPKSILEMVHELVVTQSEQRVMSADELHKLMIQTYQSLKKIQSMEIAGGMPQESDLSMGDQAASTRGTGEVEQVESVIVPKMKPSESIRNDVIICLECGKEFKQLTHTHLEREHGLSSSEYRKRYGFSSKQPLSARSVSEHRRAKAQELGLGNRLKAARARSKSDRSAVASSEQAKEVNEE
jgi:predicted transcriptional regulator